MINNIELILPYFYFNEADLRFMHCQIVQRAKDHPEKKVKEGAIKTYFVRSKEHLERLMPEIILLCEHYGARAYINLAGKDFERLQRSMLSILATDIDQGIIRNPRKVLNSAAGTLKSRATRWIVDIDDMSLKEAVVKWLTINCVSIHTEIPTVHGCHLITQSFNLMNFNKQFPNIDVHKNSMGTLLYYPKSLSK